MPYKMINRRCKYCGAVFNQNTPQESFYKHLRDNHPHKSKSQVFVPQETDWMSKKKKTTALREALKENGPLFKDEVLFIMQENGFNNLPERNQCKREDINYYTNKKKCHRFTIFFLGIQRREAWDRIVNEFNPKGYWKGQMARAIGVYSDVMARR